MVDKLATKDDLKEMYNRIYPYLGGMPEMVANKFSKGDLYSTDEKMIGQWIDGKPLYQKVFPTTATMGTSFTIMISDTTEYNIADIVECDGIRYYPVGTTSIECVPMLAYIDVNASAKPVYCYMYGAAAQFNYIILKYTKTTDSAISIGDDTDYSTEEKIVGTWIDGSPVYQKVIDFGTDINVPNSSFITTSYDATNIKTLIKCIGIYSTGITVYNLMTTIDASIKKLKLQSDRNGSNAFANVRYVIIQYTKTTD